MYDGEFGIGIFFLAEQMKRLRQLLSKDSIKAEDILKKLEETYQCHDKVVEKHPYEVFVIMKRGMFLETSEEPSVLSWSYSPSKARKFETLADAVLFRDRFLIDDEYRQNSILAYYDA